ncbi:menaquinone biosynthetic enzyme MqnA/MqnD family protein [Salidesulfovibrio onnuriiensis]|uniref:menaquinone biosynthetic enzyme MqnA/MqnD family protein n=1 Tax=Salidesulfovibrio onnuriiensis TaxID=2583823 RepID=UPI0011CAC318|nr:menaquinone biosynthesis protein [Salidesulfovibrio onnuriiensis]
MIRLGKIGYLNVLPIYHPLENGLVENDFDIVSGPPSHLNRLMDEGSLQVSASSSIEYARHPEKYYLVPDIAIGSRGPVQSVLLLSRIPARRLDGRTVLVSSQTHTSAALLKVLMQQHWGVYSNFITGDATAVLDRGERPDAILCIGDEALELRRHKDYPVRVDLGEEWRNQTGLPFIFGVWIVQRDAWARNREGVENACRTLLTAKQWGVDNIKAMCTLAAESSHMNSEEMCSYFDGLVYDLGPAEQIGMKYFYTQLAKTGLIKKVPELEFLPDFTL